MKAKSLYHKQWREKNKEKCNAYYKARKERQKNDPEHKLHRRNQFLFNTYGLTHDDYILQLKHQNNVCAICHKPGTKGKYLHIDHCHKTGRFRGLLCHQCNWYLGLVDKDPEIKIRLGMYGCFKNGIHPNIKQELK